MASATSWFDRTVRLDLDTWRRTCRTSASSPGARASLQFLPLAGALAVARRSVPAAGLFLTWLLGYVVVKGAADVATVESGSFWRLDHARAPRVRPARSRRPTARPDRRRPDRAAARTRLPARRPGSLTPAAAVVGFLAVVPLAVLLLASQFHVQQNPDGGYVIPELVVDEIGVPADPDVVSLTVRRVG